MSNAILKPISRNTAVEHADADIACNRDWVCACPSCRQYRAEKLAVGDSVEIVGSLRHGKISRIHRGEFKYEVRMNTSKDTYNFRRRDLIKD